MANIKTDVLTLQKERIEDQHFILKHKQQIASLHQTTKEHK